MNLRLSRIVDRFPPAWHRFLPSSLDYEDRAIRDPAGAACIALKPSCFKMISGVPRYFHPHAKLKSLLLSLELNLWYFYFDDIFDDDQRGVLTDKGDIKGSVLIDRMLRVLATGELPAQPTPTERICQQFWERSRMLCAGRLITWQRYIRYCDAWVRSILPFARVQLAGTLPSMDEYKKIRLENIGLYPLYSINEIDGGCQLSDEFICSPEVRRIGELVCIIVAFCNDTYSYEKELRQCPRPFNSLFLRQYHKRLSLEDAYEWQLEEMAELLSELSSLHASLTARGVIGSQVPGDTLVKAQTRQAQSRYIDDMIGFIMGNHLWATRDGRYSSPQSPFLELRTPVPSLSEPRLFLGS